MIAIDGYTYEETAKEFGTNINVIKTILHRTRQQLRIYLANIDKKKRSL
jgi:DNA-directed RNA polymerase specialized sigma24 family protein